MAEEHLRQTGMAAVDLVGDHMEIVEAGAPAAAFGEEAEIRRRRSRPMAAMVARVDDIAGAGQRFRKPRVALAMLAETMGDLQRRFRLTFRRPAADENLAALVRKGEYLRFHVICLPGLVFM